MEVRDEEKLGYCNSGDHTESRRRRRGGRDQRPAVNGTDDKSSQTLDRVPPPPRVDFIRQLQPNNRGTRIDPDPDTDPDPDPVSLAPASPRRNSIVESPPPVAAPSVANSTVVSYKECQKNHAAGYGGHVVDGCGEFMPNGDEGTPEGLRCAACGCHRSFHRKEIEGEHINPNFNYNQYSFYNTITPTRRNPQRNNSPQQNHTPIHNPHHHPQPPPRSQQPRPPLNRHASPIMVSFGGGGGGGGGPAESSTENLEMFHQSIDTNGVYQQKPKKRFRTKFNQEQKEKMMEFAERLGWKMNKQDEEEVQRFCSELDIKRQVFKVWMHNNKQAMKRKQT